MLILGIESSCDETAAAVVKDGRVIMSNIIASQVAVHSKYGGVVPELASRHHLENIVPIVDTALVEAKTDPSQLSGIAVTQGPGLVGSLLVGVNYAKSIAFSLNKPLVGVNHLEGHIYSVLLEFSQNGSVEAENSWSKLFPALCLIVSGGHTSMYLVDGLDDCKHDKRRFQLVGRTRDDAAGEAFDKVAKLLRLGYPGGPIIDRLSVGGNPTAIDFPISKISDGSLDFSFSGIKTAVLRYAQMNLQNELESTLSNKASSDLSGQILDVIASFQHTMIDMLFQKVERAAELFKPNSIQVSGGVACNRLLRTRFREGFSAKGTPVYFPSPILSTDNAAMIAAAGYAKLLSGHNADLSLNADVHLKL